MKKIGFLLIVLCCIFLLIYLGNRREENPNVIRIGAILPLHGSSAQAAAQTQEGIMLAVDSINSIIDGQKIEVVYEDSRSEVPTAISSYRHLEAQGVNTILIHGGQFVLGVAPLTKGSDQVIAAVSTPNPQAIHATDRLIRVSPLADKTVNILAQYAVDSLKATRGAIIYVNNDAYRLYNNLFIEQFTKLKGEIVYSEGCSPDKRDFKDIIVKIASKKPDFVFVASIGEQVGIITNQLLQNPILARTPILGNMNMGNPSVKKAVNANGAFIKYADVKIAPFYIKMYEDKYGMKPNSLSAQAYSAIMVLYKSLCEASSGDEQLKYIKSTHFNTAVDPLSFEESGECNLEMMIYDF